MKCVPAVVDDHSPNWRALLCVLAAAATDLLPFDPFAKRLGGGLRD